MKSYSEKQIQELTFYKDWSNCIMHYFSELTGDNTTHALIDIPKTYYPNIVSGFKQGYNDMNTWAGYLAPSQLSELNRRLREKFGKDLFDADKKLVQKAKKIAERGKIRNEEEYRLLRSYLDSIEGIAEHEEEYNRLYDIYFTFESKVKL